MDQREIILRACWWEATARKPGNVHRFRDFPDLRYVDFLESALAIAGVLAEAGSPTRVGATLLAAIQATRRRVKTNTNLGIVLLLTPLVVAVRDASGETDFQAGSSFPKGALSKVLENLSVRDAEDGYAAIRLASAGGMGTQADQDISQAPSVSLLEAMRLAADRDLIARQYSHEFADCFEVGVPAIEEGLAQTGAWEPAIVWCHLAWMAAYPDSLIARKEGLAAAQSVSARAAALLSAWRQRSVAELESSRRDACRWMDDPELASFDQWLFCEHPRRWNPGTSADLVAASLYIYLCVHGAGDFPW